ncbi:MAG: hypothetical protein AAF226_06430, partial [Verrucomicrobiota bacterium]
MPACWMGASVFSQEAEVSPSVAQEAEVAPPVGKTSSFQKKETRKLALDYLLYLPDEYEEKKHWPLLVFLHGSGERGDDLNLVKVH